MQSLVKGRRLIGWLAFLCAFVLSWDARAWVERTVVSDSVTLDLERTGSALVTHEILLAVRGGPLAEISVDPIDLDADMLPEATATLAKSGQAAGWPIPMSVTKDGTKVRLHVLAGKGLRTGRYAIKFGYRTDLAASGHLGARVGRTVVEWSGPSFADGIDSVRVVFRVPRGSTPPRLPSTEAGEATLVEDELGGVFLSTSRRAADKDELEVVRPHVAKEEVVVWRAVVDPASFDVEGRLEAPAATLIAADPPVPPSRPKAAPRTSETIPVAVATALGLLFAALVFAKGRLVAAACKARSGHSRPLVPLPLPLRGLLAGAGIGGAAMLVHVGFPTLAGAALVVAIAAATHLSPRTPLAPRGPGQWAPLDAALFDEPVRPSPLPGRFLDVAQIRGFVVFMVLLAGVVAAAVVFGRRSSYEGVAIALGASALLPLFFTGRHGELPPDPWTSPRALVEWLHDLLSEDATLSVHPIGRIPLGRKEPDELRLSVMPVESLQGVVGIEVGLDVHQGSLGHLALPFVIVRVQDGAPAADALPKGLLWTRGRSADERVAVLRPKLPTKRLTAELVREVAALLARKRNQSGTSAARSAGKASVTANAATRPSPAHAT